MKLVTFTSFKGGAGKSTALMAAVPGLLASGKRLALLEADENDTLALWRSNARDSGTWDEAVTIHEAADLGSFEASYAAGVAEDTGGRRPSRPLWVLLWLVMTAGQRERPRTGRKEKDGGSARGSRLCPCRSRRRRERPGCGPAIAS